MKSAQGLGPETAIAGAKVGGVRNLRIKKRKVKSKRKMEEELVPVSAILQELYASCKAFFKGSGVVPSSSDAQSLCRILDRMEPEDLGLGHNLKDAVNGIRRVTSTDIYQCKNFSFVLFFLPASGVIPLHNHPGMTVFNKLLFGQIHHKSYDWVDSEDIKQQSGLMLARQKADDVLSAPCTNVLYPTTGGNIHEFKAVTPCVMLDVIGPPYSKDEDRDCTFYRDLPFDANSEGTELVAQVRDDEKYAWLEEIAVPEDSRIVSIPYRGPQVIENFGEIHTDCSRRAWCTVQCTQVIYSDMLKAHELILHHQGLGAFRLQPL